MCFLNFICTVLVPLTQLQVTCVFQQNSFQRISVIFCLLIPDVIKLVRFLILYNRIILYNRTNSLVLFVFTGVTFKVLSLNSSTKKTTQNYFLKILKQKQKFLPHFFRFSLMSQWKILKKRKKKISQVGALERYFSKSRISRF